MQERQNWMEIYKVSGEVAVKLEACGVVGATEARLEVVGGPMRIRKVLLELRERERRPQLGDVRADCKFFGL